MAVQDIGVGGGRVQHVPHDYRAVVAFGFGFVIRTQHFEVNMDDADALDYQIVLDFLRHRYVNGTKNKAMTDQIMSADKSRLKNRIAELSDNDTVSIETAMKRFFNLL